LADETYFGPVHDADRWMREDVSGMIGRK
jgi:hypothetical protein